MRRLALTMVTAATLGAAACYTPVCDAWWGNCEGADTAADAATPDTGLPDAGSPDATLAFDAATPDATCGDPATALEWYACTKATDQASCEAAKGKWVKFPGGSGCSCPTGQIDCPCTKDSDCLGGCIAPIPASNECPSAGTCVARTPTLGCYCRFHGDGAGQPICVD